jgi:hypothetical protein
VKFSTILHCFSVEVQRLLLQHVGTPTNHDALVAHPSSGEIIRYNPGMLPIWLICLPLSCAFVVENLLTCSYCFSTSKTNKSEKRTSTANTVLSILAVDYPVDKVSCYVSDDGVAMLTFDALTETCLFARRWVPFCKKYKIVPRAPEWYFAQKIDYLREKVDTEFVRERRAMKVSSCISYQKILLQFFEQVFCLLVTC